MEHSPTNHAHRCSEVGVPYSNHTANAGIEGRTSVEAEPSEPDKCRAEKDYCHVVWFVNVFLAIAATLPKHESVGEGRSS